MVNIKKLSSGQRLTFNSVGCGGPVAGRWPLEGRRRAAGRICVVHVNAGLPFLGAPGACHRFVPRSLESAHGWRHELS
jgi:hypothetical protein